MQINSSPIDPHPFPSFLPLHSSPHDASFPPHRKLDRPKPPASSSAHPHGNLKIADPHPLLDVPHGTTLVNNNPQPRPLIPLKKRKTPPDFQLPPPSSSSSPMEAAAAAPNPKRVCRICSRQFSSGRALGGHMRVHGPLFMAQSLTKLNSAELVASGLDLSLDYKPQSKATAASWHKADWGLHTALEPLTKSGKAAAGHGKMVYQQAIIKEEEKEESVMEAFADDSELEDDLVAGATTSDNWAVASRSSSDDDDDEDEDEDTDFSSEGERLDSANSVVSETKIHNKGVSLSATSAAMASAAAARRINPNLYKLRDNPKKSQRFTEDEFATEMRLANSTAAPGDALMASSASTAAAAKEQTAEIRCSECSKCFWSWKALFGHMRCHPEREWRGILPPASVSEVRLQKKKFNNSGHGAEAATRSSANLEQVESGKKREHEGGLLKMALEIEMQETAVKKKLGQQLDHIEGEEEEEEWHEAEAGAARSGSVTTDDRAPRWPRGKRSRRRTSPSAKAGSDQEPTLSSETTSVETAEAADPQGAVEQVSNCLFLLAEAAKRFLEEEDLGHGVEEDPQDLPQNSKASAARRFDASPAIAAMAIAAVLEHEDESDNSPASPRPVFNHEMDIDVVSAGGEPELLPRSGIATGAMIMGGGNGGDMNMVRYECTTCKKVFTSHQALGGHRASHRKMKGCFAMNSNNGMSDREEQAVEVGEVISTMSAAADVGEDHLEAEGKLNVEEQVWQQQQQQQQPKEDHHHQMHQDNTKENSNSNSKKKVQPQQQLPLPLPGKGHECTICHRVFPSGQALGGHKRCHWTGDKPISESASVASSSNNTTTNKKQSSSAMSAPVHGQQQVSNSCKPTSDEIGIDLNLPAPMDDDDEEGDDVMGFPTTHALQQQQQQLLTGKPVGHGITTTTSIISTDQGAESKITNWVVAMDSRWRNQKDVSAAADSYKKFDGIMRGMPPIQFTTIVQP